MEHLDWGGGRGCRWDPSGHSALGAHGSAMLPALLPFLTPRISCCSLQVTLLETCLKFCQVMLLFVVLNNTFGIFLQYGNLIGWCAFFSSVLLTCQLWCSAVALSQNGEAELVGRIGKCWGANLVHWSIWLVHLNMNLTSSLLCRNCEGFFFLDS